MQRALVSQVVQPRRAAGLIETALNRIRGVEDQPLFIGREELLKALSEKLIPEQGRTPPHLVIAGGLSGVGRKTFLRRGMADFLSLELGPIFVLQPGDGLEMLHFQLLDELSETDTRAEREAAIQRFRAADPRKRTDFLAQMFLSAAQGNLAPTIVDEGALLDADGSYTPEGRMLLESVHRYPNLFVAIVHGRRPAQSDAELQHWGATYIRIPPLDLGSTKRLFTQAARRANVPAEPAQIAELSTYADGYPPAVHLAVSLAKDYGLDVLLADKSTLVNFKIHTFANVLEKLGLEELKWSILRILAGGVVLPLEAISVVTGKPPEVIATKLRGLIDYNLVLPVGNEFQLAAPIRSAVNALKGLLTPAEHAQVAARLKAAYWQEPSRHVPSAEIVNATVYAVLRGANADAELAEFGSLVMPSLMYRAAKEHYDSGGEKGWEAAKQLLARVLDLEPRHKQSLILLFKVYVRLNHWQSAEEILSRIESERFLERHYLRGFLASKSGKITQAIIHFRNAIAAGHRSVEVFHGLGSCLFQLENLGDAEKVVEQGLTGRRPNFLLWDLAAQIAIARGQYERAAQFIDELKRLGEDEDYQHRVATLLSARGKFEEALHYAQLAALGRRKRFEVLAHLADILIELGDFDAAERQIAELDESYRIGTLRHDVRLGLRCKLYLRRGQWRDAEAVWDELHDKTRPVHQTLRARVLRQNIEDPSTTPGQRARGGTRARRHERDLAAFRFVGDC